MEVPVQLGLVKIKGKHRVRYTWQIIEKEKAKSETKRQQLAKKSNICDTEDENEEVDYEIIRWIWYRWWVLRW